MMPRIYSNSDLVLFDHCPASGYASVDAQRVEKIGPSRAGQASHAVAQRYTQHLWEKQKTSDVDFGLPLVERTMGLISAGEQAMIQKSLIDWIECYEHDWVVNTKGAPRWEERRFYTLTGERLKPQDAFAYEGPLFAFTADVIYRDKEGRIHIKDWKSGWVIEHLKAPEENRQAQRYAAAVFREHGDQEEILFELHHMRHLFEEDHPFPAEELDGYWDSLIAHPIQSREAKREQDEEVYCVGSHCTLCDVKGGCPAYATYAPPEEVIGGESDEELVGSLVMADERTKILREVVRDRLADKEQIVATTHRAYVAPEVWTSFDVPKMWGVAKEMLTEEQALTLLSASKSSVKKGLAKLDVSKDMKKTIYDALFEAAASERVVTKVKTGMVKHKRPEVEDV